MSIFRGLIVGDLFLTLKVRRTSKETVALQRLEGVGNMALYWKVAFLVM